MSTNVNSICKAAFFALHRIGKIRSLLSQKLTEKLIHAFVTSRLDYCNSLLCGIPHHQLDRIQAVQNAAARLVTRSRKFDHVTPVLKNLHWLRIEYRIKYKICLTTYKIIHGQCPVYLKSLVTLYEPPRALRSSVSRQLQRRDNTGIKKTYGWRAFSIVAPILWNDLPQSLRLSASSTIFKANLKTFLFKQCY
jgi:hypothetical protein